MKRRLLSARSRRIKAFLTPLAPLVLLSPSPSLAGSPLVPIWTGAYLGFHGGGNWAELGTDLNATLSSSSFQFGGHAGYNVGLGIVVLGVEADANFDNSDFAFSSVGGGTGTLTADWNGSVRARAGLPFGPLLLYATAGYAWSATALTDRAANGSNFSANHTFNGVVYGGGLESYILPNMSVRVEALRYDYSAGKLSISGAANAIQDIDPSDTVVRAGLTFHLN